jgi:hypothetical protein
VSNVSHLESILIGLAAKDIPEQEKMTLQADIMYKSNWQQGALKGMFFDVELIIKDVTVDARL